MAPKQLPPPRPGIKDAVRAQRAAGQQKSAAKGGRPSKIDGPDFWLILDRIIGVLGQGGTDALAARTIQIDPGTFSEWRVASGAAFADLGDTERDELRHATTMYFTPAQSGGGRGPLVNYPVNRLAKLASVIEQAEANWVIVSLQRANTEAGRRGGGRVALSMLTRRFGQDIYPSDNPNEGGGGRSQDSRQPQGAGASGDGISAPMLRIKRVMIEIPSNGFRPGEAEPPAATKPKKGRKAG